MIGLTKSLASRSHLSLSQFFHSPFLHWSRSIPCSLSRSFRSSGMVILSSEDWSAELLGSALAFSSLGPQAVAVSARTAVTAATASSEEGARRALRP